MNIVKILQMLSNTRYVLSYYHVWVIYYSFQHIYYYRMAKIYCQINQCNASVQYFAILHVVSETYVTKNTFTLTFLHKNKCHSTMRQTLQQIKVCHKTYMLIVMQQNFSHYLFRTRKIRKYLRFSQKFLLNCIMTPLEVNLKAGLYDERFY